MDRETQMAKAMRNPKPVLRSDDLYIGDNGRIYHGRCSGFSARYTGRDISGQRVELVTTEDRLLWAREIGTPMVCEKCRER